MTIKTFIKTSSKLILCGSLFFITACRSEQQENLSENTNGISFNINVNDFRDIHINQQTNTKQAPDNHNSVSRKELVSGPFSIISELSEDHPDIGKNAAVSPRNIANNNVRIRIVAYVAETGEYADQVLTTVTGSKNKLFDLVGNTRYTFVTYSFNSDTANPPAAPMTKLDEAQLNITGLNGKEAGTDLLYAINKNVLLSGGGTTNIDITLKHKFSRITINVEDKVAAGTLGQANYIKGSYALKNNDTGGFTGSIPDFYTSGNLNLKDGAITEGINQALDVPNITTTTRTLIINTGGEAAYKSKLIIPANAIIIGRDTNRDPVSIAIDGLGNGLQPGKSYTLKLKFNSDRYVDANGNMQPKELARYAVIGGYWWDRFNVGVTNNIPSAANNPDEIRKEIHGAKYMFGAATDESQHYVSQADDATNSSIPPLLWAGGPSSNWNSGGNNAPTKEPSDPCDPGYRVATSKEYDDLLSLTIKTYSGSSGSSNTYGRRLYSSRSHDVQLVFPAAGFRGAPTGNSPGGIVSRGINIMYWTSTGTFNGSTTASGIVTNGFSVRCIQQ